MDFQSKLILHGVCWIKEYYVGSIYIEFKNCMNKILKDFSV